MSIAFQKCLRMLKVTFDSNVWENLVAANSKFTVAEAEVYEKIVKAIKNKEIEVFLPSGIFISEAIPKVGRKNFIKSYAASVKLKWIDEKLEDRAVRRGLSFGGDLALHPGNHALLRERLDRALEMGFKIIHMPRIAGPFNVEIADHLYNRTFTKEEQENFIGRCDEIARRIAELKAGNYDLEQIGYRYNSQSWFDGVGRAPDSENAKISVAVAEAVDGDAVSVHFAIKGDHFCTNDRAVKAGRNSVFSPQNVSILKTEFGFSKVSPTQLSMLI